MLRLLTVIMFFLAAEAAFAGETCGKVFYRGDSYNVCRFDPAVSSIRLYLNGPAGKPYGSFEALEDHLAGTGYALRFAMNGGMYEEDLSPVGLYVEDGVERKALNTHGGWGNFHLLPNGVFYIEDGRAGVIESKAFAASRIKPSYATQSGPMLVIDGKLHPSFLVDSTSLKVRNGVGIMTSGIAVFVVSDGPVRFHDFATLFRDVLDCPNALFLDGSISSLYMPEWQRRDSAFPIGPIIAVVAQARDSSLDAPPAGEGLR